AVVTWTEPTATDNCDILSFDSDIAPGTTFDVGTTTVIYTAEDIHGNISVDSFMVTVSDTTKPVIADMPGDIGVDNDEGVCSAVVTWTEPTATDNCDILSFDSDIAPGTTFDVGTTTVIYTAEDIHGNISVDS
uniref:HYR domain-containing protein n=1 Tax=uncultured Draconibacterium sp. TaxID=1573823 RepID=UPI003217B024